MTSHEVWVEDRKTLRCGTCRLAHTFATTVLAARAVTEHHRCGPEGMAFPNALRDLRNRKPVVALYLPQAHPDGVHDGSFLHVELAPDVAQSLSSQLARSAQEDPGFIPF